MVWWIIVLSIVIGYVLGSCSASVIVSKLVYRGDVRKYGSGNAGATNMARVYGWKGGLVVLLGDVSKALIAMCICFYLGLLGDKANTHGVDYMCIAGAACMFGHSFPVFFGFKGGKCVTVGAALALAIDWRVFLISISVFIIVVAITKIVSISSILAAIVFPISYSLLVYLGVSHYFLSKLILSVFAGIFIVAMHYKNIIRLCKGEEKKFSFKKKDKKETEEKSSQ